ncbi:MAG: hypothetical protein KJ598_05890, partial [Nanoarchaeota archaeon]|nr:hypothetical protein [Nanoarchaeota archaeon]
SKTTKKRKREKKSFLKKSKKKRTSSAQKKSRAAVKRLRKINQDRKKRKLVYRIEKSQKKKKKIKTVKKLRKLRKTKKLKNLKGTKRKKRKKAMPGKVKKSRSTKVTIRFRRKKNQFCISKRKFLYALLFFLLVLSFSVLSLLHYLNVFDLWYTLELFGKVVSSTVKNLSTSVRSFTLIGSFTLVRSFLSEHFLTNLYFFIVVVIGITYSILRRRYRQGKLQQRKKARVFDHKTAVSKISVEIKSGETQIDALYRIIKEKGKLSEEDALRIFKVSKEVINEWVSVLESHDLIAVAYPAFGSPVLKIAEIEKKREEGELNE